MAETMTLKDLRTAVEGTAAAFRCRRRLQPAGGPGDKVFPPTYAGAVYAVEQRRVRDGNGNESVVPCVLLDSAPSQANRMEEALQEAVDAGHVEIPVVEVQFPETGLLQPVGRITSLEAPHRIADAILRDSLLDGTRFPDSTEGRRLSRVGLHNATPLYELCPTALVFGMWDSTGPRGGLGAKFQRAIVSEVVGINASFGTKTSSRIDPLGIRLGAGPVYRSERGKIAWTLDEKSAAKDGSKPAKIKDGKPSQVNHGNVMPSLSDIQRDTGLPLAGGVTISHAEQTVVLSLPALRRLRFPNDEGGADAKRDIAARTTLAALGLCA
ncbi:MAG: type I-G CRISPR-associated RAMP protein Csb1/Cas7g, partial [bacterium]